MSTTNHLAEQVTVMTTAIESISSQCRGLNAALNNVIVALAHQLMAAPDGVQPAAWQPIATAPRGRSEYGPRPCTTHPRYVQPPKLLLNTEEGVIVGYYDWYYHPGYGRGAEPGVPAWRDTSGGPVYGPTHWMPLPPPPSATSEERE